MITLCIVGQILDLAGGGGGGGGGVGKGGTDVPNRLFMKGVGLTTTPPPPPLLLSDLL